MMLLMAWMTVLVALAQIASDAYRKFDIDVSEGDGFPGRWIGWGTCRSFSGRHDHRYFFMKLPQARLIHDACWDREAWGQLVLLKFAGKWRTYWRVIR